MELAQRMNFPWLMSNVHDKKTGKLLADGREKLVFTWKGRKVRLSPPTLWNLSNLGEKEECVPINEASSLCKAHKHGKFGHPLYRRCPDFRVGVLIEGFHCIFKYSYLFSLDWCDWVGGARLVLHVVHHRAG